MQLYEVIWKEVFAEKIESKHAVSMDEVVVVFFVWKRRTVALPVSARNMTDAERRYYEE
jgi:uncharacterized protein